MQLYTKNIDSVTQILPLNKIVLRINGKQIFNPTENMVFSDGWEIYIPNEELTNDDILEKEKNILIDDILLYDSSENVNIFYVNEIPIWLDKNTRVGLMLRFQAESMIGLVETTLWYNSIEFKLQIENALQMLYAIEIYASKCYDNTQFHISNIKKLDNIDDIKEYDYKVGYPNILKFNF